MAFVFVLYGIVCVLLAMVILMQSGRGGGLTENFAAAESMFGARTNEFMVKATTVLAVIFLLMSLGLAHYSSRQQLSLMDRVMNKAEKNKIVIPLNAETPAVTPAEQPASAPEPAATAPSDTTPAPAAPAPAETK